MKDVMPDPKSYYITADGNIYNKRSHRAIKPKPSANGIPQVQYYRNGRMKTQLLHKVIWHHFRGSVPYMHEIHYKDGDPWNCSLSNLYLKDLSKEFKTVKRHPDFAVSRDGILLNTKTMHRTKPIWCPSRCRPEFSFRENRKSQTISAARTVWETFMDERVDPTLLSYKDGDPWNCSLDNLYISETEKTYSRDGGEVARSRMVVEEDGREFMPLEYYIHMTDGVKGTSDSGIPHDCRILV